MQVYRVPVREVFTTNSYFLIDEETRHGFLLDPVAQGEELFHIIQSRGWTIEKILLTHGHFDHTGGIKALEKHLSIPVYTSQSGPLYLLNPTLNLSNGYGRDIIVDDYEIFLDGEILSLQNDPRKKLCVLYTPGHTLDSVSFYDEEDKLLFVGDTICKGEMGSYFYPSGNEEELLKSITQRILTLPKETLLLSGHSAPTTIENERPLYQDYTKI